MIPWSTTNVDLVSLWSLYWSVPVDQREKTALFIKKMTSIIKAQSILTDQIQMRRNP